MANDASVKWTTNYATDVIRSGGKTNTATSKWKPPSKVGGGIEPSPTIDTFVLIDQQGWGESRFDISVNGTMYYLDDVILLDSGSHYKVDYRFGASNPVPVDLGVPSGLRALLEIHALPESRSIYFRNKTSDKLDIIIHPKVVGSIPLSHDGYNTTATLLGNGNMSVTLAPRMAYNKDTDDLVVKVGFDQDNLSYSTDRQGLMLGINLNYNNIMSVDDFIEIEIPFELDAANTEPAPEVDINPDTGSYIYRFNVFTCNDPKNAGMLASNYVWLQCFANSQTSAVEATMRIRSSAPIHQLECWNFKEILSWGKYVCDQPYTIGSRWSNSWDGDAYQLKGLCESSYPLPRAMIVENSAVDGTVFDVKAFVNNMGGVWFDSRRDSMSVQQDTPYANYYHKPARKIYNMTPIYESIDSPKLAESKLPANLDSLVIDVTGCTGSLLSVYGVGTSLMSQKALVGAEGLASSDCITYQAITGGYRYTIDITKFKAMGMTDAATFRAYNDLRMALKAKFATDGGSVNISAKGYLNSTQVYTFSNVYTISSCYPQTYVDMVGISNDPDSGALQFHGFDFMTLLTPMTSVENGQVMVYGRAGAIVAVRVDNNDQIQTPMNVGGYSDKIYSYPRGTNKYIVLNADGKGSVPISETNPEQTAYYPFPMVSKLGIDQPALLPVSSLVNKPLFSVEDARHYNYLEEVPNDTLFYYEPTVPGIDIINDMLGNLTRADMTLSAAKTVDNVKTFKGATNSFDLKFLFDELYTKALADYASDPTIDDDVTNIGISKYTLHKYQYDDTIPTVIKELMDDINTSIKDVSGLNVVPFGIEIRRQLWTWEETDTFYNNVPKASVIVGNIYFGLTIFLKATGLTNATPYYQYINWATGELTESNMDLSASLPNHTRYNLYQTALSGINIAQALAVQGNYGDRQIIQLRNPDSSYSLFSDMSLLGDNFSAPDSIKPIRKQGAESSMLIDYSLRVKVIS